MHNKDLKCKVVYDRIIDPRERFITPKEFDMLLSTFRDRYDPRRLCFSIMYCSEMRTERAVRLKLSDFNEDFSEVKTEQCKAHKSEKDGVIRYTARPIYSLLPDWLAEDLRQYIRYRIMVGQYVGEQLSNFLIFPKLKKHNLRQWLQKLRLRKTKDPEWKFLFELWKKTRGFDEYGRLIWKKDWFRVSCHACKAHYVTCAYEVSEKDLVATQHLTGHAEIKNLVKYVRRMGITEKKREIRDRFMNPLVSQQKTPLLVGQRRLDSFPKEMEAKEE